LHLVDNMDEHILEVVDREFGGVDLRVVTVDGRNPVTCLKDVEGHHTVLHELSDLDADTVLSYMQRPQKQSDGDTATRFQMTMNLR